MPSPPGWDRAAGRANLARVRGLWKSQGLRHYEFEFEVVDFMSQSEVTGPFKVTVRSGSDSILKYKFTDEPVPKWIKPPSNVEALFGLVEENLDRNPGYMSTVYSSRGFPKQVVVAAREDANHEDDEQHGTSYYFIRNFSSENLI